MVSGHFPSFLSTDPDARGLLQWHVMVRTGNTALSYEWRQGCVYSLAAPVILVDGSDAPPSPTDPNVVVAFESGRESLSLRLENFGDGDECDGLCWFRIDSSQTSDSGLVMVDLAFGDDFFKQNRSWDHFGTIISGI